MTILLGPIMYEHHRFPEEESESLEFHRLSQEGKWACDEFPQYDSSS